MYFAEARDFFCHPRTYLENSTKMIPFLKQLNEETEKLRLKIGKVSEILKQKHCQDVKADFNASHLYIDNLQKELNSLEAKSQELKKWRNRLANLTAQAITMGVFSYCMGYARNYFQKDENEYFRTASTCLIAAQGGFGVINHFAMLVLWDNGRTINQMGEYLACIHDLFHLSAKPKDGEWKKYLEIIEREHFKLSLLNPNGIKPFNKIKKDLNAFREKIQPNEEMIQIVRQAAAIINDQIRAQVNVNGPIRVDFHGDNRGNMDITITPVTQNQNN